MNKLVRNRIICRYLRNQTSDKNLVGVELPTVEKYKAKRTGFHKGDKAPFAYNEVFTYPKDFQPWAPNYKGNGLFYGMLAGAFFAYFMYEDTYLKRTGRTRRPDREYYKP